MLVEWQEGHLARKETIPLILKVFFWNVCWKKTEGKQADRDSPGKRLFEMVTVISLLSLCARLDQLWISGLGDGMVRESLGLIPAVDLICSG